MGVDLEDVCRDFHQQNLGGAQLRGVNMARVKMAVVSDPDQIWTNVDQQSDAVRPREYQARVDRVNTDAEASASIQNTNRVHVCASYKLDRGRVAGLNLPLRLPLPSVLKDKFGDSVDINLAMGSGESKINIPIRVTTTRDYERGQATAQATVGMHTSRASGNFECTVQLTGRVLFQENSGVSEASISEIVSTMQDKLEQFSVRGKSVSFTVSGSCQFQLGNHETISFQH